MPKSVFAQRALTVFAICCLAGCGGSEERTESEASGTTFPTAETTKQQPPPPQATAKQFVRRYYAAINNESFAKAWSQLDPSIQSELGGFATWRHGYETHVFTEVTDLDTLSIDGRAVLAVNLESEDLDDCLNEVHQTFAGTWTLERVGGGRWEAVGVEIEKTGGGTPVTDGCPELEEHEYEELPPEEEPESECDPNYSGCVPPYPPDVDCDEVGETVSVYGSDPHGLDADDDGVGCEAG